MVHSMTGYGRSQDTINGYAVVVEIKSVNHRYFEYSSRLPRGYGFLDDKLKLYMQQRISRGKVDVFVQIHAVETAGSEVVVDHGLAEGYLVALKALSERYDLRDDVSATALSRYPDVLTVTPEKCLDFVRENSDHGGADVVLEVAGAENTFELAWQCARPNAIVTVVALYDKAQTLPLPDMYGKNLTFKTGGVDGCDCEETLKLIAEGKLDTEPLITHTYPLSKIDEAYELFENKRDGVIKVAVEC